MTDQLDMDNMNPDASDEESGHEFIYPDTWKQIRSEYQLPVGSQIVEYFSASNDNFHISVPDGRQFLLRCYAAGTSYSLIEVELQVLLHLTHGSSLPIRRPVPSRDGTAILRFQIRDESSLRHACMFVFTEGTVLKGRITESLTHELGSQLAQLDLALVSADNVLVPRPSGILDPWFAEGAISSAMEYLAVYGRNLPFLWDPVDTSRFHPEITACANRLMGYCRLYVRRLPRQLVHGDAHFDNVIVNGQNLTIIDFDGMKSGPRILELAPALYSLASMKILDEIESIEDLRNALIAGYEIVIPLSRVEKACIPLIEAGALFSGLVWIVAGYEGHGSNLFPERDGAKIVEAISNALTRFEKNLSTPSRIMHRALIRTWHWLRALT